MREKMLNIKNLSALALLTVSIGSHATSTSLNIIDGPFGRGSAIFNGNAGTTFTLDLTSYENLSRLSVTIHASSTLSSGYDVTGATFDGISLTPNINIATNDGGSIDYWTFVSSALSNKVHTLVVMGNSLGGSSNALTGQISFTGSKIISSVPEPETYAMLLAGLGIVGAAVKRRKATQA